MHPGFLVGEAPKFDGATFRKTKELGGTSWQPSPRSANVKTMHLKFSYLSDNSAASQFGLLNFDPNYLKVGSESPDGLLGPNMMCISVQVC